MGTGLLWLLGAACIAGFGVCLRFALQMLIDKNMRGASAWCFWSFVPPLAVCFIMVAKGDPTMAEVPRNIFLGLVGAIIGASASIWAGYATFGSASAQTDESKSAPGSPPVTISGGDNVVSIGQIGGITARTVTINPPMNPELRIIGKTDVDNPDGSRTITVETEVASPITPGLMIIQVGAAGLQQVSIAPPPTNGVAMIQMRNIRRNDNSFSAEIPSPRGKYNISIQTKAQVPIRLNASF
jgi:hypothetical protein